MDYDCLIANIGQLTFVLISFYAYNQLNGMSIVEWLKDDIQQSRVKLCSLKLAAEAVSLVNGSLPFQ
jgi:hypothetical protein